MQIIIRASGFLPYFQLRKTIRNINSKTKSRVPPRRRDPLLLALETDRRKKEQPAARRIPAPAISPRSRPELAAR
ncbi:hypothetical protein [Aquitalea magnusonii]|uniref:hypothetical protein n=1 Tax=Aquitalea magnusonii TaxID=332411 RepID=UPI00128F4C63|nr:hypothetical protein [Aquitalea magnusonii]